MLNESYSLRMHQSTYQLKTALFTIDGLVITSNNT
jgi:hypothetical protein